MLTRNAKRTHDYISDESPVIEGYYLNFVFILTRLRIKLSFKMKHVELWF